MTPQRVFACIPPAAGARGATQSRSPAPRPLAPPPSQVAFSMYKNGERAGWIRGDALRELEETWYAECKKAYEAEANKARAISILSKYNAFHMGDAKAKQSAAAEGDKILAAEEERKKAERAKGRRSSIDAGVFNAFSASTSSGRI